MLIYLQYQLKIPINLALLPHYFHDNLFLILNTKAYVLQLWIFQRNFIHLLNNNKDLMDHFQGFLLKAICMEGLFFDPLIQILVLFRTMVLLFDIFCINHLIIFLYLQNFVECILHHHNIHKEQEYYCFFWMDLDIFLLVLRKHLKTSLLIDQWMIHQNSKLVIQ